MYSSGLGEESLADAADEESAARLIQTRIRGRLARRETAAKRLLVRSKEISSLDADAAVWLVNAGASDAVWLGVKVNTCRKISGYEGRGVDTKSEISNRRFLS
jgi:hypothetical protein